MSKSDNYCNDDWHPSSTFQSQIPRHLIEWLEIWGLGEKMGKDPELQQAVKTVKALMLLGPLYHAHSLFLLAKPSLLAKKYNAFYYENGSLKIFLFGGILLSKKDVKDLYLEELAGQ